MVGKVLGVGKWVYKECLKGKSFLDEQWRKKGAGGMVSPDFWENFAAGFNRWERSRSKIFLQSLRSLRFRFWTLRYKNGGVGGFMSPGDWLLCIRSCRDVFIRAVPGSKKLEGQEKPLLVFAAVKMPLFLEPVFEFCMGFSMKMTDSEKVTFSFLLPTSPAPSPPSPLTTKPFRSRRAVCVSVDDR